MRTPLLFSILVVGACAGGGDPAIIPTPDASTNVAIESALHDTSPPLAQLVGIRSEARHDEHDDDAFEAAASLRSADDPVVQRVQPAAAPAVLTSFEGLGAGMSGWPYATPPDPNTAVGTTQIVELVNDTLAVFDKTGKLVYGPQPTNAIFSGFGGACQTSNDGDAKIRWDALANRWVAVWFSYFSPPYGLCMAVSATADATGSWHRYFWQFNSQTDSPMLGVWSDGYYVGINGVLSADNLQIPVCAFDRAAMLTGAQATRQCFSVASTGSPPFPADFTGGTAPPTGEAETVIQFDRSSQTTINAFAVHVDWTTPANSTITNEGPLTVAAYTLPQSGATQPGTTNLLQPGVDLFPIAYRNLGDHESIVLADQVAVNGVNAPRWYELRLAVGKPTVYQQGTFAPGDGVHRYMPSIAMDAQGGVALGYTVSSSSIYPGIRVTGRVASDPLGQLTQGETTVIAGAGAQTSGIRWGDYSSMSVDPADGCTFWYTQEYLGSDAATSGWRTRTASFRLPGCAGSPPPPSGIVNGDFETGALAPWTSTGTTAIATTSHAGSYAALAGKVGTTTKGDSSIAQSFTAPATGGTLTFWYKVVCLDSLTYDWATATLADTTAGTTSTPLAKKCSNTGAWAQVSATLVANHAYTLTLVSHDDGYSNADATYTLFDDVAIGAGSQPPPPSSIVNGDFETGALAPWTSAGTTSISTVAHGGKYAAQGGKVGVTTKGDSSVAQSFTAPATGGTLSFWYRVVCLDSVTYDWATATLKDTTAGTSSTPLAKKCSNTGAWAQVSATLVANHAYTLTLVSHDDGYSNADATYTLFDDATVK